MVFGRKILKSGTGSVIGLEVGRNEQGTGIESVWTVVRLIVVRGLHLYPRTEWSPSTVPQSQTHKFNSLIFIVLYLFSFRSILPFNQPVPVGLSVHLRRTKT